MGFLKGLFPAQQGMAPNGAAMGLGHLLGADPSRISSIADRVGQVSNRIAGMGGAEQGYQPMQMNNIMQKLDPAVLQALIEQFQSSQIGNISTGNIPKGNLVKRRQLQ